MKRYWLLLPFAVLLSFSLFSQAAYYTVRVGTFVNPKLEDFENIQSLGFVYALQSDENLSHVYLGDFEDGSEAEIIAEQLKRRGYLDTFVEEQPLDEGETVTVIQLALKNVNEEINWSKLLEAGPLYTILGGGKVKVATGVFESIDEARANLAAIKRIGFEDAFIKRMNSAFLHEVTPFETKGLKRPLIPLNLSEDTPSMDQPVTTKGVEEAIPETYDVITRSVPTAPPPPATVARPEIRSKVKRTSSYELQKVLKKEGTYKGSLDGYYGKGTESAYNAAIKQNRQWQKYALLSSFSGTKEASASSPLQQAINTLPENVPVAMPVLESSAEPVAKAYRAYALFMQGADPNVINDLMNAAIKEAFSGDKVKNQSPFNYKATYAYNNDLDQLILHLRYIQEASGNKYAVPCWLFHRHPEETKKAFEAYGNLSDDSYRIQESGSNCIGWDWEELNVLETIASDLNSDSKFDEKRLIKDINQRTRLFVAPAALTKEEQTTLQNWNTKLWSNLNSWAQRDPLHEHLTDAFKIAFFQSQVMLEDYFMNENFNPEEAKGLSLAVLRTYVDYHLERFQ